MSEVIRPEVPHRFWTFSIPKKLRPYFRQRKRLTWQLARHKVHPRMAQQLMGHSKIDLTMRVYTEVDDDQLREAMDCLPSMHHLKRKKFRVVDGKK